MLIVHPSAKDCFQQAKDHARRVGLASQFAQQLNWLRTYGQHDAGQGSPTVRVILSNDFAPYSFSVTWERRKPGGEWRHWFNGGLIFHGPHDNGGDGGAPTFSVCLEKTHGWSIHT